MPIAIQSAPDENVLKFKIFHIEGGQLMKDIILLVVFLIYGVIGYFLMKKLDKFIDDNQKNNKK